MKNQYGIEPCPFCGTSVVSCEYDGHYIWVECGNSNCKASMMAVRMDNGDADEAKKIWNTRPIEDALRAQLAEAQAEVDRLEKELVLHNSKPLRNKPIEGKVYIGEHDPNIIVRFGDNEEYPDGVWCSE
jgi:hypothetical protein